jgi:hypothetical protein
LLRSFFHGHGSWGIDVQGNQGLMNLFHFTENMREILLPIGGDHDVLKLDLIAHLYQTASGVNMGMQDKSKKTMAKESLMFIHIELAASGQNSEANEHKPVVVSSRR